MAKVEVRMGVDPFRVIAGALERAKKRPRLGKIVSVDYDEEADVMYARFRHGKIVDSEPLDTDGLILASLDSSSRPVGLVILHASSFA
jgi:uncharacterized protein YuzE